MGYRGSGKSTLGRAVADRLGLAFVDLDDAVRARFDDTPISVIWRTHGEPAFRAAEADACAELLSRDDLVLALGGGTPMQPRAAEALRESPAVKLYLHAPAEVLHDRIHADATSTAQRPALTSAGGGLEEVSRVLAEREPTFRALADHTIDTTDWTLDALVERVVELVRR